MLGSSLHRKVEMHTEQGQQTSIKTSFFFFLHYINNHVQSGEGRCVWAKQTRLKKPCRQNIRMLPCVWLDSNSLKYPKQWSRICNLGHICTQAIQKPNIGKRKKYKKEIFIQLSSNPNKTKLWKFYYFCLIQTHLKCFRPPSTCHFPGAVL